MLSLMPALVGVPRDEHWPQPLHLKPELVEAHVDEQRQIHRFSLRERLRQNRAGHFDCEM